MTIMISCKDDNDNFAKKRLPVNIYDLSIPTSGTLNQDIEIQLKAKASNGCYSDLKIEIIEIDSRHFLFKADGLFKTNGICPYNLVYKDTIIVFKPTLTGKYFFQANEVPFEVKRDTLGIN